ncbi:MAG: NAD(P)-binding domain-containing protein [Cytophagales bacterium]|nr:NAD(P)-binding domain-containing protein [Cytophagales bacterium]
MKIAIIGTGNVGGTLATKWALKGHTIYLGVKDQSQFKGLELLKNPNTSVHAVEEAVKMAEVIISSSAGSGSN